VSTLFRSNLLRLGHLSDDTICRLLNGELGSLRMVGANSHLTKCWQCRARREAFDRAALRVIEYRKQQLAAQPPLDRGRRQSFLRRLDQLIEQEQIAPWWSRLLPQFRFPRLSNMNPVYASAVVVGIAVVLIFWIWQRSLPPVSAAVLLDNAVVRQELVAADSGKPGVIYQKVMITTVGHSMTREIYRDRQNRRHPRPQPVKAEEARLQESLRRAGVEWDAPLSATSYKEWHDREPNVTDRVRRLETNLLTLTTTVSTGNVAEESLTVRAEDFHPVERLVEMRNQQRIEIAELNYAVLGWDAVNPALFEDSWPVASAAVPAVHAVLPKMLPTPAQLDLAELEARVVLHRLGADAHDQIALSRSDVAVHVKGIVDTTERKYLLTSQLLAIPHVHSEILSMQELNSQSRSGTATGAPLVQSYPAPAQPSPLAVFLQQRNMSPDQLSRTSQQLLDACLKVQQSGAQLTELRERFASPEDLRDTSRMAFENLFDSYAQSLTDGLDQERAVLDGVGLDDGATNSGEVGTVSARGLQEYIQQNQNLCQELIAGSSAEPRPAATVADDLKRSIAEIRAALAAMQYPFPQRKP
jgi:hypothetical protein